MDGPIPYAVFDEPIPKGTIATTLYIGYHAYVTIPKPRHYRAFFVMRDPRDIVVSWYFSARYSHQPSGILATYRQVLSRLPIEKGLMFAIDTLLETGEFALIRSWGRWGPADPSVRILRYEDLACDLAGFVRELLGMLEVYDEEVANAVAKRHSFARYAKGRKQGSEDIMSHYRKGVAGDWKQYFTPAVEAYFRSATGDLLEVSGYA